MVDTIGQYGRKPDTHNMMDCHEVRHTRPDSEIVGARKREFLSSLIHVVLLKRFSGEASLARAIATGDPYAAIEERG